METEMAITIPSHPHLKLGKKPSSPIRLPHFNHLKGVFSIDTSSVQPYDYAATLPTNTGMMYNDTYGDCTAAAKYHRLQVVVWNVFKVFLTGSALQDLALHFYSLTTGFDPTQTAADGSNPTDQGGNMQDIAEYLVKKGMLRPDGSTDQFVAAFMINPQSLQDLVYCGRECMGIDFGINVTTNVMPPDGTPPPKVWQAGGTPMDGHDVFGPGFLNHGNFKVISWGSDYEWTPAFGRQNVTEAIAYVSADSLSNGKTVLGQDLTTWQNFIANHSAQPA
jgi:hypothetical protein